MIEYEECRCFRMDIDIQLIEILIVLITELQKTKIGTIELENIEGKEIPYEIKDLDFLKESVFARAYIGNDDNSFKDNIIPEEYKESISKRDSISYKQFNEIINEKKIY